MALVESAEGLRTFPIRTLITEGHTEPTTIVGLEEVFRTTEKLASVTETVARQMGLSVAVIPAGEKRKYPSEVQIIPEGEAEVILFDASARKLQSDKLDMVFATALELNSGKFTK